MCSNHLALQETSDKKNRKYSGPEAYRLVARSSVSRWEGGGSQVSRVGRGGQGRLWRPEVRDKDIGF